MFVMSEIKIDVDEQIGYLLKKFVEECERKFGLDLVSIVLFGSYARGRASKYSDVDLLVIAKNLPDDWRVRDRVLSDLEMRFLKKYHKRIFPVIISPEAISDSVKKRNPFFYGVLTGYRVLFDRERFFAKVMENVKAGVRIDKPIFYDKVKKWVLAEI